MASTRATHRHSTAEERRDVVLDAAVAEFAIGGLHGTATEAIAVRAGISQPYVFRLFGSKKELFLAALERGFDRIDRDFARAAGDGGPDALERMGRAYADLLGQREELLLQMQGYAACSDPDVAELMRRRYGELYRYVEQTSGADEETVRAFFSKGMLMNVAAAMDLPELLGKEPWVQRCLGSRR